VAPARRERAGGDGPADPPGLTQARGEIHQVAERERGQDKVEAAVAERQRCRIGGHRVQRRARAPEHANGQVRRHHPPRPGQPRVHLLRAVGPFTGGGVVGGP